MPAKTTPGRNARFAGMKNRSKIRRIALRSISGRNAGKGSCRDARLPSAGGDLKASQRR